MSDMGTLQTIVQKFQEGGIFMYFILLLGITTVAFIAERIQSLYKKVQNPPENFRQNLLGRMGYIKQW